MDSIGQTDAILNSTHVAQFLRLYNASTHLAFGDRMEKTTVYLVRHGSTTNPSDVFSGSLDPDLSIAGNEMAAALGLRLAGKFDAVYCSNKRRAIQTAERIIGNHDMDYYVNAELREIDHGRWEGKTKKQILEEFPEEYAKWDEDPMTFAPIGGETGLHMMSRVLPAFREILAENVGKTAVVVSHKAVCRVIVASALGIHPRYYRERFDLDPASLTILEFSGPSEAKLKTYNDTSHWAK